jgi:transcriptional regulator GlxA family with amidase domain
LKIPNPTPWPPVARHAAIKHANVEQAVFLNKWARRDPVDWGRARRPQELLETTNLSIEQVASTVGFRSASVLPDHFGGIVGTAPL